MNAEVVGGTIASRQDAVDYLTWTFFFRRLLQACVLSNYFRAYVLFCCHFKTLGTHLQNPSYYNLEGTAAEDLNLFLSALVTDTLLALQVLPLPHPYILAYMLL